MSSVAGRASARAAVNLSNLSPAPKAQHAQRRVGRGQGSHHGGTAGRGANGQKSRTGPGPGRAFEGGQTPIVKLFPKSGFVNSVNGKTWQPVNLDRIQFWIDQGRLTSSPENPITARELLRSGCVHDVHDGIKLLGDGSTMLKSKIYITPSRASKSAVQAIESLGGKVVATYHNALALRDEVSGRTDRLSAAPTRRNDIMWYTSWKNRGYLSPKMVIENKDSVDERTRKLSIGLNKWKTQEYAVGKAAKK